MEKWNRNIPLASMETWLCWQNMVGQPEINPVEYVDWYAAQGLNWMRLFSWQRHDYRPWWNSDRWWHRLQRYVNLTREAGIYLTPSLCQGVHPDNLVGQDELDVANQAVSRFGDEPHILWEFGNELRTESHQDGTAQKGIDILGSTGQPVLWAPSESVDAELLPHEDLTGHALRGWTVSLDGQRGKAHISDHVHDDLNMRLTETMIAAVDEAKAEGAIAFAGLGKWRSPSTNHLFGLESWKNQGALADMNRPDVVSAIVRNFASVQPAPGPDPQPEPEDGLRRVKDRLGWRWDQMTAAGYDGGIEGGRRIFVNYESAQTAEARLMQSNGIELTPEEGVDLVNASYIDLTPRLSLLPLAATVFACVGLALAWWPAGLAVWAGLCWRNRHA